MNGNNNKKIKTGLKGVSKRRKGFAKSMKKDKGASCSSMGGVHGGRIKSKSCKVKGNKFKTRGKFVSRSSSSSKKTPKEKTPEEEKTVRYAYKNVRHL